MIVASTQAVPVIKTDRPTTIRVENQSQNIIRIGPKPEIVANLASLEVKVLEPELFKKEYVYIGYIGELWAIGLADNLTLTVESWPTYPETLPTIPVVVTALPKEMKPGETQYVSKTPTWKKATDLLSPIPPKAPTLIDEVIAATKRYAGL